MQEEKISKEYNVRKIEEEDVENVLQLFLSNPQYFEYCKLPATRGMVQGDRIALPSGKLPFDKHYVGYYSKDELIAVLDLVERYPNKETCFIGFFMVDKKYQGKGVGSKMMKELFSYLKELGFQRIRLGYIEDDLQAKDFWLKCGFDEQIKIAQLELYNTVLVEKKL